MGAHSSAVRSRRVPRLVVAVAAAAAVCAIAIVDGASLLRAYWSVVAPVVRPGLMSLALIAFLSAVMTLEPGDIVTTGTPAGVGLFQKPPVFMKPGDIVEIEADGIGVLRNAIVAAEASS